MDGTFARGERAVGLGCRSIERPFFGDILRARHVARGRWLAGYVIT